MTEQEIDEVDGALWGILETQTGIECETTVYKFTEKNTPINEDLGSYRYNVLTFKPTEAANTIGFMKANIGDVRRFIDNYAKAGYNGLMVKDGCVPKKTIKDLIKAASKNFNVPNNCLKEILAQV